MAPFSLRMAWREWRHSRKRLGLYMGSISLGVAALVAINSFRSNVSASVSEQAKSLLGADLELRTRTPWTPPIQQLIDSLKAAGVPTSSRTGFGSMVLVRRTGRTRLFEVRAVSGGYPYYGAIATNPAGLWETFRADRRALVDPAVLVQLDAGVGDTLGIGEAEFVVAGTVVNSPGDVGLRAAIGPRVFIPEQFVEATQLLRFGSRAEYHAYFSMPDEKALQRFINLHNKLFEANRVGVDTVAEQEEDLSNALGTLARYLGLVGLIALLLGGMGVASAVHVFAKEKLDAAAVLRCLGATQGNVLTIYVLQAAVLGLAGAALGAVLGLATQAVLPSVVKDFLPLAVRVSVDWGIVGGGLALGVWVAVLFALLPLLALRRVPPLRALRHDFGSGTRSRDPWRVVVLGALAISVLAVCLWQAPRRPVGLAFAGAVGATALVLWLMAWVLTRATRRFFPAGATYVVRQGIANLFRPQNQTAAVIQAIGFGVFLVATLYLVQYNLLRQFSLDTRPDRPNLVMFDIQSDQRQGLVAALAERKLPLLELTPIVPARIAKLNDRTVDQILKDSARAPARWALRREYRNTYRDTLVASEELVGGRWWTEKRAQSLPRISLEEDLARELRVKLGDRITWDVQGVPIETEIASLRHVTWARFAPNFFVVFEPGVLERAPQMYMTLTHIPDADTRAVLQRDLVERYSNISILDLTLVQNALDSVLSKVTLAIRFMALFSIASGILILIGALATTRFQRVREAVLLKTLGARGREIRGIQITEYFAWGSLAAFTGVVLAGAASGILVTNFFDVPFRLPALQLAGVGLGVALLTVAIGVLSTRDVVRRAPLAVLREMGE